MNSDSLTLYQQVDKFSQSEVTALYFRSGKINFRVFCRRIDEMASKLYDLGIRKDQVVSLLAPNVPETIIAFYALNKIGAIVALLHPLLPKNVLLSSLLETKSVMLLLLDARYNDYKDSLKESKIPVYFLSAYPDLKPFIKQGFKILYHKDIKNVDKSHYLYKIPKSTTQFHVNEDPKKPSVYLRSGGTTGKSKTVILNDDNVSFAGKQSEWILKRKIKGISMIGVLPLFHGYGLSMGVHAPLMNEAASCLMISYSGKEIVSKVRKGRLNVLIAVPYLARKLLNNRKLNGPMLKNLYATYVGADKPEEELFQLFDKKMVDNGSENRLLQGYGLTETVTVNFVNTSTDNRIGSVGKPLLGVKLRIAKDSDFNKDIGPDNDGIIMISSDGVCLGYLNTPKEKQPFHYDYDGTKWLITGDIGHYDKDGYLFFKNRATDVLKIAGYSIFPSDIEMYANRCPNVKSSAAVYINSESHPYVHLFLETDSDVDQDKIKQKCLKILQDNLIRYSVPEKITVLAALPRTEVGKIDKKKLREVK